MAEKIIKTGHSAAVTIPVEFMRALSLKIGDKVKALMNFENGTITYSFPENRQLKLKESEK